MPRTTRTVRPLLVSAATAGVLALAVAPTAHAAGIVERVGGEDRYETAVELSASGFSGDGSAEAVVLARGDEYADAVTGGALAAAKDAPLLLTQSDRIPQATGAELERVLAEDGDVYLLGGTSAINADVADAIEDLGYEVTRLGGDNRYETAIEIAEEIAEEIGDDGPVLVATGTNFPDSLTAAAAAAAQGGVVLLSRGDALPDVTDDYLGASSADLYAIGGPAAGALAGQSFTAVTGEDRWGTAVLVAGEFFEYGDGLNGLAVASGQDFPDALAASASSGRNGHPVLLAQEDNLPSVTSDYIEEITVDRLFYVPVIGGEEALSEDVLDAVRDAFNPSDEDNGDNGDEG